MRRQAPVPFANNRLIGLLILVPFIGYQAKENVIAKVIRPLI